MISDAEKARRYRVKLVDLIKRIEDWHRSPTVASERAVVTEAQIVKQQLENEDRFDSAKENPDG